jgi:hypothetical protein
MHAVGQHRLRVAQVDVMIQAVAKEVIGHWHRGSRNSQKKAHIEYLPDRFDYHELL